MKWLKKLLRMQWLDKHCEWMVPAPRHCWRELQRRLVISASIRENLMLQLLDSKQEIRRLTALATKTDIISMQAENGELELVARPPVWAVRAMAASFYDTLRNAPNWQSVEVGPMDHEGTLMIVTVRRANGQTPEETVGVLRSVIEDMLDCIDPDRYPETTRMARDMLNPTQEK